MCSKMVKDFNMEITPDELLKANYDIRKELIQSEGRPEIPYVRELIKDLHANGLKLIIASSSKASVIEEIISGLKLKEYFNGYVSGEMVARPKPAPDIFLAAANKLCVAPSECIVIEDSYNGLMAAKAAEMACIGFYNPNSGNQDLSCADYIVEGFDEVDYAFVKQVYDGIYKEPVTILTTENFIIRELTENDIDSLYLLRTDPDIRKYLTDTESDIDIEKEKLRAYIKNVYKFYGFGLWGVFLKENGRLIGQCGIEYKTHDGKAIYELGYLLGKNYQGKGYAYEFTSAVINYCFKDLAIDKIHAIIEKDNEKSIRLAQKLGMQKTSECIRNNKQCYVYEIGRN